jgi:hypothetical protein
VLFSKHLLGTRELTRVVLERMDSVPTVNQFDPLQANGHNLLDPIWQRDMELYIQRTSLSFLRMNTDSSTDQADPSAEDAQTKSGETRIQVNRRMPVDLFGLSDNAQNTANDTEQLCQLMLVTELEGYDAPQWMACSGSGHNIKATVPIEKLYAQEPNARQFVSDVRQEMYTHRNLAQAPVVLRSLSQRLLPLYHYLIVVKPGDGEVDTTKFRNPMPTAFVRTMQHCCVPLTRELFSWLVRHVIPRDRYEVRKAHELVFQLWGKEDEEGSIAWSVAQKHCLEQTFEFVEARWRLACSPTTTNSLSVESINADNNNAGSSSSDSSSQARPENLGKNARDWLLCFLTHPEVARYFGGDSMRRLARYWPLQWLMGLSMTHGSGMTDAGGQKYENHLQRLEKALSVDPSRFCAENARPQNIVSREYAAQKSSLGACKPGLAPVLNLEQVMRACVDYNLMSDESEQANWTLMDLVVNQVMRHTFYTKFHMCCSGTKLCSKVKKHLLGLLDHCHKLAQPSPALWYPPVVHATSEYDEIDLVNYLEDSAPRIDTNWFRAKQTMRIIQSAGRLCSTQYQRALVPCMAGKSFDELLERMTEARFNVADLDELWLYVRESHDMEGMLLYGAYRICNQVSFIAQRDGPLPLRQIPAHMSCCSEQLAFLRYALGYDPYGQHTVPCTPFANAQGRGGAGKTQLLELLSHILGDTRELLVLAYQGSHIANVERRFPHLRTATIRQFMHKHSMLCTRTLQTARSTMSPARYKQFSAMIMTMKKRMVNNAQGWQADHAEENRLAAEANGGPFPPDEHQRRQYGPEAFTYGMPFQRCSLERVRVVVIEEFAMTPKSDVARVLNSLAPCCPNLCCFITMGDKFQLYPISHGHVQQSFLEGFGWMQFDHLHRQGEGCLSQLARAMQEGNPDLIKFDGRSALLVDCDRDSVHEALQGVCKHYRINPYMSQIIARTNDTRQTVNALMKPHMYPNALSVLAAKNNPSLVWGLNVSHEKHQLLNLQRAAREYDALEKVNFKRNIPSLKLCNNGTYIVWCALVLQISRRRMDANGQCDAYGMPLENSMRKMSLKQWQAEAQRAAAQNEQESIVAAQLMSAAGDGTDVDTLTRDFYGTLMGIDSAMALAPPLSLTDEAVIKLEPQTNDTTTVDPELDQLFSDIMRDITAEFGADLQDLEAPSFTPLPSGLFNSDRPTLDNGPGTRPSRNVQVRLPRTALLALLKASDGKTPDDVSSNMYEITIERVLSTTMDPPGMSSAALAEQHARTVLLCSPFYDDMDVKAPVDQRNLVYMPFVTEMRKFVQPAICVTGHCAQGFQYSCVIFILPYWTKRDTKNYGYLVVTRALKNLHRHQRLVEQGVPTHPSLIVIGTLQSLQRMAVTPEPERISHTGRLLRMVHDITCKNLPSMDYSDSAWLEHQEAGQFGKRDDPFLELYAKQLNTTKEAALDAARIRVEQAALGKLLFDFEDDLGTAAADDIVNSADTEAILNNSDDDDIDAALAAIDTTQFKQSSTTGSSDDDWLTNIPNFSPIPIHYENSNGAPESFETHQSKRPNLVVNESYQVRADAIGDPYPPDKPCLFDVEISAARKRKPL